MLWRCHADFERLMHIVYLSLGSNIGNRRETILKAIEKIKELVGNVDCQSALYETEPWGFSSENMFINAAVRCSTDLTPRQVLETTQRIECELGRVHKSLNAEYKDRIIDIDILLYDDCHIDEPDLKIPHPFMKERDFVMKPLNEILNKK